VTKDSAKAKVGYFEISVFRKKDILGFEVAVADTNGMNVSLAVRSALAGSLCSVSNLPCQKQAVQCKGVLCPLLRRHLGLLWC
jgi:hypothetical protein